MGREGGSDVHRNRRSAWIRLENSGVCSQYITGRYVRLPGSVAHATALAGLTSKIRPASGG